LPHWHPLLLLPPYWYLLLLLLLPYWYLLLLLLLE
jgi:hypothetical protein